MDYNTLEWKTVKLHWQSRYIYFYLLSYLLKYTGKNVLDFATHFSYPNSLLTCILQASAMYLSFTA